MTGPDVLYAGMQVSEQVARTYPRTLFFLGKLYYELEDRKSVE